MNRRYSRDPTDIAAKAYLKLHENKPQSVDKQIALIKDEFDRNKDITTVTSCIIDHTAISQTDVLEPDEKKYYDLNIMIEKARKNTSTPDFSELFKFINSDIKIQRRVFVLMQHQEIENGKGKESALLKRFIEDERFIKTNESFNKFLSLSMPETKTYPTRSSEFDKEPILENTSLLTRPIVGTVFGAKRR